MGKILEVLHTCCILALHHLLVYVDILAIIPWVRWTGYELRTKSNIIFGVSSRLETQTAGYGVQLFLYLTSSPSTHLY